MAGVVIAGIASLIVTNAGASTHAYPITPRALLRLYTEADLVVVAKCGKTTLGDQRERNSDRVPLTIEHVVKGKGEKEITVAYSSSMG